jgi:hypothetical protein
MEGRLPAISITIFLLFATGMSRHRWQRRLNPVLLHNCAWITSLSVYSLGWVKYDNISVKAWLLIAGGIACVNAPTLFTPALHSSSRARSERPSPGTLPGISFGIPLLFALGVAIYFLAIERTFGLATLVRNPATVRTGQGGPDFLGSFPVYGRLLFDLGPMVIISQANPALFGIKTRASIRYLIVIGTIVALASSLSRTLLLVAIVWHGTLRLAIGRTDSPQMGRPRGKQWVTVASIAMLGLVLFQVLGGQLGKLSNQDVRYQRYVSGPLRDSSYTAIVIYATGSLPAFSALLKGASEQTSGAHVATLLNKVQSGSAASSEVAEFVNVPFPINTYTWFEPFYRDYGSFGLIAGALVLGYLLTGMCLRADRSLEALLVATLLVALAAWAPSVNKYVSTFTWEYILIFRLMVLIGRTRLPTVVGKSMPTHLSADEPGRASAGAGPALAGQR